MKYKITHGKGATHNRAKLIEGQMLGIERNMITGEIRFQAMFSKKNEDGHYSKHDLITIELNEDDIKKIRTALK